MKNHPGKIMEKRGNVDTKKTQTRNKLKSLFFKAGGRPDSKKNSRRFVNEVTHGLS